MKTEKLKLNHLAPYLPYGLKCESTTILFGEDDNGIYEMGLISMRGVLKGTGAPILRPLSDLSNEILTEFNFIQRPKENEDLESLSYGFMKYCFENHFDVYGLIEKKLAIDINNLEQ